MDGVTELKPLSLVLLDVTNVCDTSGDENISGEVRGDSCAKISSSLSLDSEYPHRETFQQCL